MSWNLWLALSVGLFLAELFFGARLRLLTLSGAALVVSLLTASSLLPPGLSQLVAFSVLALLAFLKLRSHGWARIVSRGRQVEEASFVGETVVAQSVVEPGYRGPVLLDGTVWSGLNVGDEPVGPGGIAMVDRVDGLILEILTPGSVRSRRLREGREVDGGEVGPAAEEEAGEDSSDP